MTANTSFIAFKQNEKCRKTQTSAVFSALEAYSFTGNYPTAEQISRETGIKITTVYARLNNLKAGYIKNGVTWYCVPGPCVKNTSGNKVQTWALTVKASEVTREDIDRLFASAMSAIVRYRNAKKNYDRSIYSKNKNLFDNDIQI